MSDSSTNNTLTLKLGNQIIRQSSETISNSWERCYNNNYVYIDSLYGNNRDKAQFFIDPTSKRILLGQTRLKPQNWTGSENGVYYNVYLNTTVDKITEGASQGGGSSGGSTGGGSTSGTNFTLQGGYGINITELGNDVVQVSVNDNVIATKDDLSNIGGGSGSGFLTSQQESQLRYILKVLTVQYSDDIQYTLPLGTRGSTSKTFFAFSYQYKEEMQEDKIYNAVKILNVNNGADSNIYAVIRKCENIDEETFHTLPTFVDNAENTEDNLDKFEYLLNNSKPIAISSNYINQNKSREENQLFWYFPTEFTVEKDVVYLITIHSQPAKEVTTANTRLITLNCDRDATKSQYVRIYNRNFTEQDGKLIPNVEFCYKKPIGIKLR